MPTTICIKCKKKFSFIRWNPRIDKKVCPECEKKGKDVTQVLDEQKGSIEVKPEPEKKKVLEPTGEKPTRTDTPEIVEPKEEFPDGVWLKCAECLRDFYDTEGEGKFARCKQCKAKEVKETKESKKTEDEKLMDKALVNSMERACEKCNEKFTLESKGRGRPKRYCPKCDGLKEKEKITLTCKSCDKLFEHKGRGRKPSKCNDCKVATKTVGKKKGFVTLGTINKNRKKAGMSKLKDPHEDPQAALVPSNKFTVASQDYAEILKDIHGVLAEADRIGVKVKITVENKNDLQ